MLGKYEDTFLYIGQYIYYVLDALLYYSFVPYIITNV
jgi:hypothetical protein